jgi:hypothetical protein
LFFWDRRGFEYDRFNETRDKIDMKIEFRLWIGGIFFLVATSQSGLAQSQPGEDSVFDSLKTQIVSIAAENNELVQQNKKLKAQLVSLQLEVERYEKELKELDPDYVVWERTKGEPKEPSSGKLVSLNDWENDPLINEAQDLYLSGQSMDLEPDQKLRELQLYDLQFHKQELLLDLHERGTLYQKIELKRRQELGTYQEEIQKIREEENDLSLRIAELEKRALGYPQEIDLLKMENKELKRKVALFKQMLSK